MSTVSYTNHEFALHTKTFERETYNKAIATAKALVESKVRLKIYGDSRRICNKAYSEFKEKIEAKFPGEAYADLVSLTLKSRQKLFFLDLKEHIVATFNNLEEAQ